jgi:transcriptional regulator with XRE-family HTH domain
VTDNGRVVQGRVVPGNNSSNSSSNKNILKRRTRRVHDSPERTAEIWRMWSFGYSQEEIAKEFGLTQGRISQIICELREAMPRQSAEEAVEEALQAYREMIRTAFKALQPKIEKGDADAIREMRALQMHSLRMMGFDPAKPIMVGDTDFRVVIEGISNEELARALT